MQKSPSSLATVLAIGGHDPSGGAGIQADIEAVAANGGHAVTLVSCLTVQDSCNVQAVHPVTPEIISAQAETLLADHPVGAIKIGLLGSPEAAEVVLSLLHAQRETPVVLDPILAAGGGSPLAGQRILSVIKEMLPLCDLITPNSLEARRLSGLSEEADSQSCARELQAIGANSVLITGSHEQPESDEITHRLYLEDGSELSWRYQRLPGEYHGSGCTLASAIAAHLARGKGISEAIKQALDYSWRSLLHGFRIGRCQALPERLYSLARFTEVPHD